MENKFILRLKQRISELGISQAELSQRTGIRASSISDYINGKYIPKQDKVALISKALNVEPGWLMGYDTEKTIIPIEKKDDIQFSNREKNLVKKYRFLPELVKDEIDGYVDYKYESQKAKVEKDLAT